MKIMTHVSKLKPLTEAEELYLYQTNKPELVVRYLPLALKYLYRYRFLTDDVDEILTIGYLRIWSILKSFDPSKGVRFHGYCVNAIKLQALKDLPGYYNERHDGKVPVQTLSLEGLFPETEESNSYDSFADPSDIEFEVDMLRLKDKISKLDSIERTIVEQRLSERPYREIAKDLGISHTWAETIAKRAFNRLAGENYETNR